MNLIFSADRDWGIGRDNRLLFRSRGDMVFFRQMTTGRCVIMGRSTLESLPGGRPLHDRDNIVLTRNRGFVCPGAAVCRSLEELFAQISDRSDDDLFVIGGEQIYRQLMPYARLAYVTRWNARGGADRFVPDLDRETGWRLIERSEEHFENGITYRFCTYAQDQSINWRQVEG